MAIGSLRAARRMHLTLLKCCLRWPLIFFDTTPIGRILNRFSNDVNVLDVVLPQLLLSSIQMLFTVIKMCENALSVQEDMKSSGSHFFLCGPLLHGCSLCNCFCVCFWYWHILTQYSKIHCTFFVIGCCVNEILIMSQFQLCRYSYRR